MWQAIFFYKYVLSPLFKESGMQILVSGSTFSQIMCCWKVYAHIWNSLRVVTFEPAFLIIKNQYWNAFKKLKLLPNTDKGLYVL
jgi:hypothetical protein